jgi:hypothetical protein
MITTALDVDEMEMDPVPEPINFIALRQAAVNEGFAGIALDTKVAENACSHQPLPCCKQKRSIGNGQRRLATHPDRLHETYQHYLFLSDSGNI